MKTSHIRIRRNVLEGIMEFRADYHMTEKYNLEGIGFSMDESKGKSSSVVRYHVSDGHIGITGTCGEIEGDWLPETGVSLPASIYPKGCEGELTILIEHDGMVTTRNRGLETRQRFKPKDLHAPILSAIPVFLGGKLERQEVKMSSNLINCKLSRRVLKGLSTILGSSYLSPIRVTMLGSMEPIVFTAPESDLDLVAVQMPMMESE